MSSKSRTAHSNFFGILFLGLLAAGLLYVAQVSNNRGGAPTDVVPAGIPQGEPNPASLESDKSPSATASQPSPAPAPTLLLTRRTDSRTDLIKRSGTSDTVVFTDADESSKIQSVLGIRSGQAYVITGTDALSGAGVITAIALDGSGGIEKKSGELLSVSTPSLHPTEDRVALVSFDNAERSFGFTLYTERFDGRERLTIDFSESGIGLPVWHATGRLAYTSGQATPDQGVQLKITSPNNTSQVVYTTEPGTSITDLAWRGADDLILAVAPLREGGPAKTRLLSVNVKSGTASELLDQPGQERSLAVRGELLAYLVGSADSAVVNAPGELYLSDLASGRTEIRGTATDIVGWLEE